VDLTAAPSPVLPALGDRQHVDDLYARYNLAVDLGEVDAWVSCFVPDGRFSIVGHTAWAREAGIPEVDLVGHPALRGFMSDVTEERRVRHWTTNLILRRAPDGHLSGMSLMTVWDLAASRAGEVALTGVMRDRLVRHGGHWFFSNRQLTLDK
jgi:hypothetical protein